MNRLKLGNLINNHDSQSLGRTTCWNQKTNYEDSLEVRYPNLASELINLVPSKVRTGLNKYGEFICSKHKLAYEGKKANIVKHGNICSKCLGFEETH